MKPTSFFDPAPTIVDSGFRLQEMLDASVAVLSKVHPLLREACNRIIADLAQEGLYFAAFQGLRTYAEQDALYAQGRESLGRVNARRLAAGMKAIPSKENEHRITRARAGQSFHQWGLAVDLVQDGNALKPGVQWSWASVTGYLRIGRHAKNYGLEWGGLWHIRDWPHVQLSGDLNLERAGVIYRLGGNTAVWHHIDRVAVA